MRSEEPLFSVIIPVYNRSGLVLDTLESLLTQDFQGFEVIAVDDGSKDDSLERMRGFAQRYLNLRVFGKHNGERGAARNYGVAQARGRYVSFMDSDDVAYPGFFRHAASSLEKLRYPECFAQAYETREKATDELVTPHEWIGKDTANQALLHGNMLSCIGVFVQREIAMQFPFDEDRLFSGTEDWLLWLQLAARYDFHYSDYIAACMFQHDDRSVMSFPEDKLRYRAEHLRKVLGNDEAFLRRFGKKWVDRVYAHMLSYASLHLVMQGEKKQAWRYLSEAVRTAPGELITKRTSSIFLKLMRN